MEGAWNVSGTQKSQNIFFVRCNLEQLLVKLKILITILRLGRGLSIWDTFSHTPGKIHNNENGDVADGHYFLYKSDIALMKQLGFQAFRISLSWSRILPTGECF